MTMTEDEEAAETLAMAQALGWPAGFTAPGLSEDEPIVIAGGEAAWRKWMDAEGGGDPLRMVHSTLAFAIDMIEAGIDPGPPETWGEKHARALEEWWPDDWTIHDMHRHRRPAFRDFIRRRSGQPPPPQRQ